MPLNRLSIAFALFLMAACLAGCGGSGSGSSSGTGPVVNDEFANEASARSAFIKEADAICAKADTRQIKALEAHTKKAKLTTAEQEQLLKEYALPPIQREAEELADLKIPKGAEPSMVAIIGGIEKAVIAAEANPHSVLVSSGPFVAVEKLATEFGFQVCNQPA